MNVAQSSLQSPATTRVRTLTQAQIDAIVIAAATLLSFILHLPFLTVPLITDEGGYAYGAHRWFSGQGTLYKDLYFDRPQGIFVVYGLIQQTLGESLVAIRLGAWIATALTLFVVWYFTKAVAGREAAGIAAVAFAIISGSPAIEGFTANAEIFMGLPSAVCALLLLHASRNGWKAGPILTAGVMAGVATLIKQSGIVLLPVAGCFIVLALAHDWRRIIRSGALFGAGAAAMAAISLIHGWMVGWDDYLSAVGGRVGSHSGASIPLNAQVQAISKLIPHVFALLAIAFVIVLLRFRRVERPRALRLARGEQGRGLPLPAIAPGSEGRVLLRLWLLACLAGIALGGNWFPHYVTQIAAPFAIWMGWELSVIGRRLPRAVYHAVVLVAVIVLIAPYSIVPKTRANVDEISTQVFTRSTYGAQDEVAAYLKANSTPEQTIYIAFFQASMYYLADREAAYPHLYLWELQANPNSEDELIAMVGSPERPVFIVKVPLKSPYPNESERFWTAVSGEYHLDTTIGGMEIYRAN